MDVFVTQVKGWVKLKAAAFTTEHTQDREERKTTEQVTKGTIQDNLLPLWVSF